MFTDSHEHFFFNFLWGSVLNCVACVDFCLTQKHTSLFSKSNIFKQVSDLLKDEDLPTDNWFISYSCTVWSKQVSSFFRKKYIINFSIWSHDKLCPAMVVDLISNQTITCYNQFYHVSVHHIFLRRISLVNYSQSDRIIGLEAILELKSHKILRTFPDSICVKTDFI